MPEYEFARKLKKAKVIQLCVLLVLEVGFIALLICTPSLGKHIYDSRSIFTLCAIVWVLMLFYLLWLINDLRYLKSLALESHMLNRQAFLDGLTGILNRNGLDTVLHNNNTLDGLQSIGCFMITIDNLLKVNEELGRDAGDNLIRDFCAILETVGDSYGITGRNGGNDFIVFINKCSEDVMNRFTEALMSKINIYNEDHTIAPIMVRYASLLNSEALKETYTELLTATYNKLHEDR